MACCPKVSVVVPVYNLAPHVADCLEGLIGQETDFPFEIIVGDDGSTDGSRQICDLMAERCPERVRVLPAQPNMGLVRNLKRLMAEVRGAYVAYLDGDDVALPGKLALQAAYLDANPGCALVYHESDMFDSDSGQSIRPYSKGYYNWPRIPRQATLEHLVRYGTFLQASAVMFRAHPHLVEAIDDRCRIIADYPMHIMNVGYLGGTVDFIDHVLGRYRVHAGSFSTATAKSAERRVAVTEELATACRNGLRFGLPEEVVTAGVGHVYYAAALYFLKRGEDELFQTMLARSTEGGQMFDDRHRTAWQLRNKPDAVRAALFPS